MCAVILSGKDAFANAKGNPARKYPGRKSDRVFRRWTYPKITPSFTIDAGQQVFTIGSCFARNIEEELATHGVDVPTLHYKTPRSEITATGRDNKALNQYNAGTMLQCVREIEGGISDAAFYEKGDGVVDALLHTGGFAVTPLRMKERRQEIRDLYASELPKSNVTIITLGLTEAWFDTEAGLYLNVPPSGRWVAQHPDRFQLVRLQYDDILSMVDEIVATIQKQGCPNVLLTVSPVPLNTTFGLEDCVVANGTSKATLRAVAGAISAKYDGVDYFPSYEIVTSGGNASFENDLRHVKSKVVARIVSHMLAAYMPSNPKFADMAVQ